MHYKQEIHLCFLIITLIVCFYVTCSNSKNPANNHNNFNNTIALTNGYLIDGTGSAPLANVIVIIQDEYIKSVGTDSNLEIPAGAEIIDLNGSYILSGFMNTHVHSGYDEKNLNKWAISGITTVRDLGDFSYAPKEAFSMRTRLLKDNKNARLVAAGPLVTTVGGYGNYSVTSPDDAEIKINGLIDAGADLIKIAIEDNLQGRVWPMLSMAEIEMIVQTAHNRDKRIAAHISRSKQLEMAIRAGVDERRSHGD